MNPIFTINEPSFEVLSPSLAGLFPGQEEGLEKTQHNSLVVEQSRPGLNVENMTIDEARHILRRRRTRNVGSACWPCRLRKVKCERKQPCENCVKRDHPQFCVYRPRRPNTSTVQPLSYDSLTSRADKSAEKHSGKDTTCSQPQSTQPPVQALHLTRNLTKPPEHEDVGKQGVDIDSKLMTSTFHKTIEESGSSLPQLPSDYEIFRLFKIYKEIPHIFWEFVVDINDMELKVIAYLEKRSKTRRQSDNGTSSWLALLYSILAVGAQYQELPYHIRHEQSNVYTQGAFYYLYLNNALRKPKFVHIQALLLLSFVLLNNTEVSSSRAVLDLTYALAQSIGLYHDINDSREEKEAPVDTDNRRRLWWTYLRHRSLISQFCGNCPYDSNNFAQRNHSIKAPGGAIPSQPAALVVASTPGSWTYLEAMCHILQGLEQRFNSAPIQKADLSQILESCEMFESIADKLAPYLRDRAHCKTANDYLQHYSVQLHISFSIGICCRPVLWRASDSYLGSFQQQFLIDKCTENLKCTIEMFLAMNRLSIIPARSWTFIQIALSSALFLGKISGDNADPGVRQLLGDLILALSEIATEEQHFPPTNMQNTADAGIFSGISDGLQSLKDLFQSFSVFKLNEQQSHNASVTQFDINLLSPAPSNQTNYSLELDDILPPKASPTMGMATPVDEYLADPGHNVYMSEDIYQIMLDTVNFYNS
ncbi:hypothetical protein BGZ63DRAFT_424457 [Mariannaea sp. PMI_226]|nr:hypothetical protein BGZ63DRAFT_424457 [Mariannaea sp. PMI_226]